MIQIPPSLFAFKLAYVVDLLPYEERGITFKIQTLGDEFNFRRNPDPDYHLKKESFLETLEEEENRQKFVRMLRYGIDLFPEVFFAIRYYCGVSEIPKEVLVNVNATIEYLQESAETYGKVHPSSLTSLVIKLEISYRSLERFYKIMLNWSGYPTRRRQSQGGARRLSSRLHKQDILYEKQQRAEQYRVGELLPPHDLPEDRWIIWQHIMLLYNMERTRVIDFFTENPDLYRPLAAFYKLWNFRIDTIGMRQIAEEKGITVSGVSCRRERALIGLGIIKEA